MCHQTTLLYLCLCTQTLLPTPCSLHHSTLSTIPLCAGSKGILPILKEVEEECSNHREMRIQAWVADEEELKLVGRGENVAVDLDLDFDFGIGVGTKIGSAKEVEVVDLERGERREKGEVLGKEVGDIWHIGLGGEDERELLGQKCRSYMGSKTSSEKMDEQRGAPLVIGEGKLLVVGEEKQEESKPLIKILGKEDDLLSDAYLMDVPENELEFLDRWANNEFGEWMPGDLQ